MHAIVNSLTGMIRNTGGRLLLGTMLAGAGAVSTAQAHHDDLDVALHGGVAVVEHRHFVPPVYEDRATQVWVEATYATVPGPRVWIPAEYRTVVDHVWREPVIVQQATQVSVAAAFQDREIMRGHHVVRVEHVFVPAHVDTITTPVVATPGHYEDVSRQELVADGHWQVSDQQVLATPAHYETRIEHVLVREGHWEERPVVRIDGVLHR